MMRNITTRLKARPIAVLAVAINSLALLFVLISFFQPNVKICKVILSSNDVFQDCSCLGSKIEVTQVIKEFGDIDQNIKEIYECRGIIIGVKKGKL